MSEEVKERLSKEEYEKVGEMLIELIAACPHTPQDLVTKSGGIKYPDLSAERCIGIIPFPVNKYISYDITGGFTAQFGFAVAYKSFPTGNSQNVTAQAVVDNIMGWLENVEDLPKLSGGRIITKITASNSAVMENTGDDKSVTYAAEAVMQYRKKGV